MAAIGRAILTLLMAYIFTLGGTFNGVLMPELKFFSLGIITIGAGIWFYARWRGKWIWYNTPLDYLLVLWGAAFSLSLLANLEDWRRIMMGLWYVGVYLLMWYALNDAIANRKIQRVTLIDSALMGSLIVVFFGFFQLQYSTFNLAKLQFPRPGSVIGNPNSLGAFLVILGILSVGRWLTVSNKLGRWLLAIYSLAILTLLFLTFSRGAWIGMGAGLVTLAGLHLMERGLINWETVTRYRSQLIAVGVALFILLGIVGIFFIQSFNQSGRSASLRTTIYQHAISIFNEQPVTGQGLFTFGAELAKYQSQPPRQPHSHAHNGVLQVTAELGTVGLGALVATAVILIAIMRTNLQIANPRQKGLIIAGMSASIGFGVHHLFDFPAMMPVIALLGLMVIILAATPINPLPIEARWRLLGHPVSMMGLAAVLIVSGMWSTSIYATYNNAIQTAFPAEGEGDYRAAAEAMQSVVDADPEMSVYINQQAYLYGLAANEGDASALDLGIAAYQQYVELEPQDAYGWANLSALYAQAGRYQDAINAAQSAIDAAPDALYFHFLQGTYAEADGDMDLANAAYMLALVDGTRLWLGWDEQAVLSDFTPDESTAAIMQLANSESVDYVFAGNSYRSQALNILAGNSTSTLPEPQSDTERAWQYFINGQIAEAREVMQPDFAQEDVTYSANIPYYQFLRFAIPRRFLPQVNYPSLDPILAYLIYHS